MTTRRSFFRFAARLLDAPAAPIDPGVPGQTPSDRSGTGPVVPGADDEQLWRDLRLAFTLDRTLINLNNGGVSPSPRVVHEAFERYAQAGNRAPARYLDAALPGLERVRRALAGEAGCDPEELAITRNTSEGLQTVQLGLRLAAGDEVLTTNQEYTRMLDTWGQRARRDGIRLVQIPFPVPASHDDLLARFERAITSRTRVLHFCHMTARTGQIFPVRELCRLARDRQIQTVVDGAHGFAHVPFRLHDLGCDYYATSLHKWLQAPVGTGFLYVRRERIADLWPLRPAPAHLQHDIRKFEDVGTDQIAGRLAIAEALAFHRSIGTDRKNARLRYLRDLWRDRLAGHPRLRMLTSRDPALSCGIGSFGVRGLEPEVVAERLWDEARAITLPIWHREYRGVRISASVYTTPAEIDTFVETIEAILGPRRRQRLM